MKYQFKGIIRGTYSGFQAVGIEEEVVITYSNNSLHELLNGLAIDEWAFILKVNGRKIKKPIAYIKRQGLDPKAYMRVA